MSTTAVPSKLPEDFALNIESLDKFSNSADATFANRLGISKRTLAGVDAEAESRMNANDGIEAAALAVRESLSTTQRNNFQSAADLVLAGAGYAPPVLYAAGIILTLKTQTVEYAGNAYAPKLTDLPFTTSGVFEAAKFRLIQGIVGVDLAAPGGALLSGYMPEWPGAVAATVAAVLKEVVSVFRFMTAAQIADVHSATPELDLSASLAAARAFIAANATRCKLIFPSGIYRYSVSPNWGITNAVIESQGEVRLRYTGTGEAVIIDAGGGGTGDIYSMKMGQFIVEAPATAMDGVYVRGIHHSNLGFNVRGAGNESAGILVKFAVCTTFEKPTVSVNEEGWYLGAKPAIGLHLTIRNAGEFVSYCTFNNPIIEGPPIGMQLNGTLGNSFIAGTSEGCPTYGVFATVAAHNDKFVGTDFEVNTEADVYCQGDGLTLIGCDSEKIVSFGTTAKRCAIIGGAHSAVLFDAGSAGCSASNMIYNRLNNGASFVDAGTDSKVSNVTNAATNKSFLTNTANFAAVSGIVASGSTSINIAVPGAKVTDTVVAALSPMTAGFMPVAYVSSPSVVTVTFYNMTGATAAIAAGTLKAVVSRT